MSTSPLLQRVEVARDRTLDDYAALTRLAEPVAELGSEATKLVPPTAFSYCNSCGNGGGPSPP